MPTTQEFMYTYLPILLVGYSLCRFVYISSFIGPADHRAERTHPATITHRLGNYFSTNEPRAFEKKNEKNPLAEFIIVRWSSVHHQSILTWPVEACFSKLSTPTNHPDLPLELKDPVIIVPLVS